MKRPSKRRSCNGKVLYRSIESARMGQAALERLYFAQRLHVYRCDYGNHWHVGHRMRNRRRR